MIKISIITVVYNNENTIEDTIISVLNQDYKNFEYIIIDGNSTDNTLLKVYSYDKFINQVISENDFGIYDAMNKGINLASGDVIGFINADDFYFANNVFSKVEESFRNHNIDACYSDLCYIDKLNTSKIIRYWKSSIYKPNSFINGWSPPHPTFFARSSIYKKYGNFNLSYKIAADWELMFRFIEINKIRIEYIPDVFVKMRVGGVSNSSFKNIFNQNLEILLALYRYGFRLKIILFFILKVYSRLKQYFIRF